MRILAGVCCLFLAPIALVRAQTKGDDPYSIRLVESAFKTTLAAPKVRTSFIEKNLSKLGDGVSIALIKFLTDSELKAPATVDALAELIRQAFSSPESILIEADRTPKVTLMLLQYLHQSVGDARLRAEIQDTIQFVNSRAPSRGHPQR